MTTRTSTAAYSLITCRNIYRLTQRKWYKKNSQVFLNSKNCSSTWMKSKEPEHYMLSQYPTITNPVVVVINLMLKLIIEEKKKTCLMALAPTESMKLADVQSRMMEWTVLRGSRKMASSESDSSCLSCNWPFFCSSVTGFCGITSWVTPCFLYYIQSKK